MDPKPTDPAATHRAAIIYEVSRQVQDSAAGRSFRDALHLLALQTRLAIGAHQSAISYIPRGEFRDAIHAVSLSEKYDKYLSYDVMPTGQGIWSVVMREKQAVCMTAAELHAHPMWLNFSNLKDARGLEHPPMRGWLAAPVVRADGEVLGFLQLTDKLEGADFDAADLDLLARLANMVLPTFELHFVNQQLSSLTEELRRNRDELDLRIEERTRELRERTERFELVAAGACDAIWDWDVIQHRVTNSPRWAEMRGYAPHEIGEHEEEWLESIHKEDHDRVLAAVQAHFNGRSPVFSEEYRIRCKDGSWKWIHDRGLANRDAHGRVIRMAGSASDIHERKQTEEALRLSESRFRTLVEHAPEAIVVLDVDRGAFVQVNENACRLFEMSREELLHHGPLELSPPEQPDGQSSASKGQYQIDLALSDRPSHFEWVHRNRHGREIPCEVFLVRLPAAGQRLVRGSLVNITERHRAAQALRASEQRFRDLFENSPDAIFVEDFEGQVLDANPAACRLHNLACSDLIGKHVRDLVPPAIAAGVMEEFRRLSNGELTLIESQSYTSDGRTIPVEIRANPILLSGQLRLLLQVRDISERKQAEEKLRISEALFRSVVEGSLQGILIHQDDRIRFVNPSLVEMFGYSDAEEILERILLDTIIAPEDRPLLQHRISSSYSGSPLPLSPAWRGMRKDGSIIWIVSTSSPVQWNGRQAIVAFLVDITERKQAEESLRVSEIQFRSVVQGSLHGILINQDDCFQFANPALVKMFGYESEEEMLGNKVVETVISPEAWPTLRYRIASSYQGIRLPPSEPYHGVRKDGSLFWVISTSSLTQWNGRPALVAFIMDVDDRKRAEETREATRRMLQVVLDHIPQGVFWKDRNSVYLGCNQVVAAAFGLGHQDQIVGRTDHQLPGLSRDQAEFFIQMDREVMDAGTPRFGIIESATFSDGRVVWLETTKVPLQDAAGRVVGILGTWQDVTDRKRIEEERTRLETQLQHTQKLESLGVLAGGIAHDFNNLLTSILGYADLALLDSPPGSSAREHIASAAEGARRAAELTNQMLAYSGKGRFVVEPLNLSEVVEDLTRLLQISISKKCVMKFDLTRNLPSIEADASQVRQVTMNLIINANEAIGEQSGVIAVTTGVMNCDRAYLAETYLDDNLAQGAYVFLEVADTGCGMSEEVRARIFDPFFSTKFTGRGLGLSAVLGIVRGHRGAIKCYSEPGKGTTFKVLFPASDMALQRTPPIAPDVWQGTGTVLVVDDEPSIRLMAERMFEAMGFNVLTAENGREGVDMFRKYVDQIRFVLLDMTMPILDGEETFREMRRIRPDVRAILTSGYNEQTATSRFAGKGLAAFIQKPYGFADLRTVVQKVLSQSPSGQSP